MEFLLFFNSGTQANTGSQSFPLLFLKLAWFSFLKSASYESVRQPTVLTAVVGPPRPQFPRRSLKVRPEFRPELGFFCTKTPLTVALNVGLSYGRSRPSVPNYRLKALFLLTFRQAKETICPEFRPEWLNEAKNKVPQTTHKRWVQVL